MEIIWDSMKEVRNFMENVNLKKISQNEQEWCGLGFIITGRDIRGGGKSPVNESYTLCDLDHIVVTPYWKELSWVFRNVYRHPGKLSYETFMEGFWAACTGFFLQHPSYKPEKAIEFIFNFLSGIEEQKRNANNSDMTIEEARNAEKAFNEELKIFKEAALMNRANKEGKDNV